MQTKPTYRRYTVSVRRIWHEQMAIAIDAESAAEAERCSALVAHDVDFDWNDATLHAVQVRKVEGGHDTQGD